MTRKDYEAIAQAVRTADSMVDIDWPEDEQGTLTDKSVLVDNLCSVLKADNTRFDSDTFKRACGL